MKKATIAIIAVAALSVSAGLNVPKLPGNYQSVRVAADTSSKIKVVLINSETQQALPNALSFDRPQIKYQPLTIPRSALPAGYGFTQTLGDSISVDLNNSNSISIPVSPVTTYKINLVDAQTDATIKTVSVDIPNRGNISNYNFAGLIPAGYHADEIAGDAMAPDKMSTSSATNYYISKDAVDKVQFVNIQDNSNIGSPASYSNTDQVFPPKGYVSLYDQGSWIMGEAYGKYVSIHDGTTFVKVRPSYANKTISAPLVTADGTKIGTGVITFNDSEFPQWNHSKVPAGYQIRGIVDQENAFLSGNWELQVQTADTSSENNDDNPIQNLQNKYSDLLAKYNSLQGNGGATTNSSDISKLSAEVASLKSQLASVQVEINFFKQNGKQIVPNANAKTISLSGKATITSPANVYNASLKKTFRKLAKGTSWKIFKVATDARGHVFYNVGGSQYISANNAKVSPTSNKVLKFSSTATIKYVPGYSVQVWGNKFNNPAKNANGSCKMLKNGTSWKVFGITSHSGHMYYNLGGNQFIDANYVIVK